MKISYVTSFTGQMLRKILSSVKLTQKDITYEVFSNNSNVLEELQPAYINKSIEDIFENLSGDVIILGGYMRIVPEKYVTKYKGRMINYHPSYLPDLPGKDPQVRALKEYKTNSKLYTGGTVHFVDEGVDTGQIIAQERYFFKGDETEDIIFNRLDDLGAELLTQVINHWPYSLLTEVPDNWPQMTTNK